MEEKDLVIIGGGPAGLAAAIAAREKGIEDLLIIERDDKLGGILNQCIHNGFGLHTFNEELTGPEYAQRFIDKVIDMKLPYLLNTMVLELSKDKIITCVNENQGIIEIKAKAVILAMGCRERPRGAINIPGSRCAGIYAAGTAQKFVNIDGIMPGKNVVILGSGDIGLIMARRITLEGGSVKVVVELMPYSGGLKRNIVQCLEDFDIPLKLSHTIVKIYGKERVEGVTIAQVDENRQPIKATEEYIPCDTILLSVGLLPENELSSQAGITLSTITGGPVVNESLETSLQGVFSCGNVLHVHDLVDFVTMESYGAGASAAKYIKGGSISGESIKLSPEQGVRYTVPSYINPKNIEEDISIRFRVGAVFKNSYISIYFDDALEIHIKKKILTPGEMETVKLKKAIFDKYPNCKSIRLKVEEK